MVKHIIIWKLREEFSEVEKLKIMENAKRELEALKGKIDGLLDINLQIEILESSKGDMLLDSTFVDETALRNYAVHPIHMKAADEFVRPFVELRLCIDYNI